MSTLYARRADNKIKATLPGVPFVDLYFSLNGQPIMVNGVGAVRLNPNTSNVYEYTIPFNITVNDGKLKVKWQWESDGLTYSYSEEHDVVTPIVSFEWLTEQGLTTSESRDVERLTRHIINSYTGQEFGHFSGVIPLSGNGTKTLTLPRRLNAIDAIAGQNSFYTISGSGFFLNSQHVFNNNQSYSVAGDWGYHSVPESVAEAAKIIAKNFIGAQPDYRSRYVDAIRSADWRVEYNSRAFDGTGNVHADQLLDPYVIHRIVVI